MNMEVEEAELQLTHGIKLEYFSKYKQIKEEKNDTFTRHLERIATVPLTPGGD
ncbi:hypothetical protein P7K49_003242, partial [Saguinus oedipus]